MRHEQHVSVNRRAGGAFGAQLAEPNAREEAVDPMIDEQSGYLAENKAVGRLNRPFTITKKDLAQFRHAWAALGRGGSTKRLGQKRLIDEQSWDVTENKALERLNRRFTITKQVGAACTPAEFWNAGWRSAPAAGPDTWGGTAHGRTKLACS